MSDDDPGNEGPASVPPSRYVPAWIKKAAPLVSSGSIQERTTIAMALMKYLGDKEVMSVVSRDELESAIKTLLPLIDSISGSKFLLYLFHYSLRCIVVVFS